MQAAFCPRSMRHGRLHQRCTCREGKRVKCGIGSNHGACAPRYPAKRDAYSDVILSEDSR